MQIAYFNTPDFANPHAFVRDSDVVPYDWRDYDQSKFVEMKAAYPEIQLVNVSYSSQSKSEIIAFLEKLGNRILNVKECSQ